MENVGESEMLSKYKWLIQTNALLYLINNKPHIDEIYLYAKDPLK